jgi:TIR domain
MKKPASGFSAFISYASDDREKAHEICRSLEGRGLTCWIAPRDVRAGREYADEIVTGIENCRCLVVLLSKAANASAFVCREVERAVANHKPIFPVRVEAVMPDGGLELFISGTHWLDAWEGDWHDHLRRLVRDVADLTAGASRPPARPDGERRRLRVVYGAAALVVAAALSGFAMWTSLRNGSESPASEARPPSSAEPVTEPVESSPALVEAGRGSAAAVDPKTRSSTAVEASPGLASARDARAQSTLNQVTPPASGVGTRAVPPPDGQPSAQRTAVSGPSAVQRSAELDGLHDDYSDLSLRGGVIDDTLNRLWEEMRPLAPRLDIATRQRSLKASLTRARDALDNRDAAAARKYLETARADAAALDEFLGR